MDAREYEDARKELGLSQTALAQRLEVSRETVNKRESGKNGITEEAALAIRGLRYFRVCSKCGQEWYRGVESECQKRSSCGFKFG